MGITWTSSTPGYPRLGENREWKRTLESFWSEKIGREEFLQTMKDLRLEYLQKQKDKGIDLVPVGDFSYYDHILDTAVMFGLIPERFQGSTDTLQTYFNMARGTDEAPACEMTKWFNTNYHYIVPELGNIIPSLHENKPLQDYKEAKQELGLETKPVLIGPFTLLKLSKGYDAADFNAKLEQLLPLYTTVLQQLQEAGASWVQIDEPSLVPTISEEEVRSVQHIYETFAADVPELSILLQTYFEGVHFYEKITSLPVAGIGLDFVHGYEKNMAALKQFGFPEDKTLAAGVIDGRNIWRADLKAKEELLKEIDAHAPESDKMVQPSCSLLHVPVTKTLETKLDSVLYGALSFADEKLEETAALTSLLNGYGVEEVVGNNQEALKTFAKTYRQQSADLTKERGSLPSKRELPFAERKKYQDEKWDLPLLPTTTIGSFPQTKEVRVARQQFRRGEKSPEAYNEFIRGKIKEWIDLQEDIGLDVLVHGEFERNDMVEFFGEKLNGFAFTSYGWVQSYGSRCVKPPIIYDDVTFDKPMTVEESRYAQSLTDKPVKGMLTGPVTILNWSFERDDIPRKETSYQIAVALSREVQALEEAGIDMIQVDEPAVREGLPLKREEWDEYLDWSVTAFRLATSNIKPSTQIHTHMCYSEFQDMIESIRDLDADVISIETSRSHGELIESFETAVYEKGIGLGVYDIHSPRVPSVNEMKEMIDRALRVLPADLFWINPDCGLKTRNTPETVDSLKNMVQAAQESRKAREMSTK
ncbi:5-methyltetrahydropteroyltriglutamate--homocysteine S-methyltransferase [Salibacterium halotolerans]|uniref:5-methyltetrahydropteroyltriglutamate--homocysteine methyltransferase n=1 Tax=Salibacterium halotolerans TaxID=1884432 RepID=A0A1I5RR73_9BACI|nr:5-methyltetrahydropteroyltriglutamate--homocysteine S-methyltransferase [Salibacterium halotolerans]SFP61015.1 5-methyltetrahydropteroyltriglutamate--homocysteine methyltransferase [Salibacterium halotolerans]